MRIRARLKEDLRGGGRPVRRRGAPGYDPFGPDGANFNNLVGTDVLDAVSGTASRKSGLCEIWRAV